MHLHTICMFSGSIPWQHEERKKKEGKRERQRETAEVLFNTDHIRSSILPQEALISLILLEQWQVGVIAIKVKLQPVLPELQVGRCRKLGSALWQAYPKQNQHSKVIHSGLISQSLAWDKLVITASFSGTGTSRSSTMIRRMTWWTSHRSRTCVWQWRCQVLSWLRARESAHPCFL